MRVGLVSDKFYMNAAFLIFAPFSDKDDDQMTKEMDMAFDMEQMRLASNLLNPLQDADN